MEVSGAADVNRFADDPPSTKNSTDMHLSCRSRRTPPCASAAVSDHPRCRRASPLLSVLLASVGDHRDEHDNAQSILEDHLQRVYREDNDDHPVGAYDNEDSAESILEDHLLRVWDETSACAVAVCTTSCVVPPPTLCRCRHDTVETANSSRCA